MNPIDARLNRNLDRLEKMIAEIRELANCEELKGCDDALTCALGMLDDDTLDDPEYHAMNGAEFHSFRVFLDLMR